MMAIKMKNRQIIGNLLIFLNGYLKEFEIIFDKSIKGSPKYNLKHFEYSTSQITIKFY